MSILNKLKSIKGAVFVISMCLSLLMILIAVSASNMLLRDAHMINRLKLSTEALYIAEAGASVALGSLADTVLVGLSAGTANGAIPSRTYQKPVIPSLWEKRA